MEENPALAALDRIRDLVLRCAARNEDPSDAELAAAIGDGFEVLRAIVIGLTRPLVVMS